MGDVPHFCNQHGIFYVGVDGCSMCRPMTPTTYIDEEDRAQAGKAHVRAPAISKDLKMLYRWCGVQRAAFSNFEGGKAPDTEVVVRAIERVLDRLVDMEFGG